MYILQRWCEIDVIDSSVLLFYLFSQREYSYSRGENNCSHTVRISVITRREFRHAQDVSLGMHRMWCEIFGESECVRELFTLHKCKLNS